MTYKKIERAVEGLFEELSAKLASAFPNEKIFSSFEKSKNQKFPLRLTMSFMKNKQHGDELVVSIDIKRNMCKSHIECDICGPEGVVIAVGPSGKLNDTSEHSKWIDDFKIFLIDQEQNISEGFSQIE